MEPRDVSMFLCGGPLSGLCIEIFNLDQRHSKPISCPQATGMRAVRRRPRIKIYRTLSRTASSILNQGLQALFWIPLCRLFFLERSLSFIFQAGSEARRCFLRIDFTWLSLCFFALTITESGFLHNLRWSARYRFCKNFLPHFTQ